MNADCPYPGILLDRLLRAEDRCDSAVTPLRLARPRLWWQRQLSCGRRESLVGQLLTLNDPQQRTVHISEDHRRGNDLPVYCHRLLDRPSSWPCKVGLHLRGHGRILGYESSMLTNPCLSFPGWQVLAKPRHLLPKPQKS